MEKVTKILELQTQGKTRDEIVKLVGYEGQMRNMRASLNRFMKGKGYRLDSNEKFVTDDKLIDKDDNSSLRIKPVSKEIESVETKEPINKKVEKQVMEKIDNNNIINIVKADNEIKQMLEYFNNIRDKRFDDNGSHNFGAGDSCKVDNRIMIDLDTTEEQRTTIRVNKEVWSDFKELCDDNSSLKYKDILSMALKEFTEKYK